MNTPLFIVFEGLDGSGKTTQAKKLHQWLEQNNTPTLLTREPGGTPLAESIRALLVQGTPESMTGMTEALLFNAARHEHLEKIIKPALDDGKIVVCDRYFGSTLALQTASGMNEEVLWTLHNIAQKNKLPDLTIFLTGDVERLIDRANARENGRTETAENRFEEKGMDYHKKVKSGFEKHMTWDHVVHISVEDENGNMRSIDDIFDDVKTATIKRLKTLATKKVA